MFNTGILQELKKKYEKSWKINEKKQEHEKLTFCKCQTVSWKEQFLNIEYECLRQ